MLYYCKNVNNGYFVESFNYSGVCLLETTGQMAFNTRSFCLDFRPLDDLLLF